MRGDDAGEDVDGDWPPPDERCVGDDDSDDFSRDLKNKSNYSQMMIMLKIRGVLTSTMDLNI